MDQDTRKDRRVKIVSLNVRYKSATVDEFIENHAHDVSRGGIYIKTASPFPPGTLLKFEIRLASDQAVIAGVGRVVWKRESASSAGEHPAGMGVKFIKIDEPSKTVIDRLVNTRADAGKAFESEAEMPVSFNEVSGAKPAVAMATVLGTAPPTSPRVPRKATMMGLGIATVPPPSDDPSSSPETAATGSLPGARAVSGGMFPSTGGESDRPPRQEQTVMKQAAELLEEALREAGGSLEEIGTNPLFSSSSPLPAAGTKSSASSVPPDRGAAVSAVPEVKAPSHTENKKSSTPPIEVKTPSMEPGAKAKDADDAAKARAMVAGMAPAPRRRSSQPPRTSRAPGSGKGAPVQAVAVSPAAKKGGGGVFIVLFVLLAATAGAVVMYRDGFFGSSTIPEPTAPATTAGPMPSTTASTAASAEPSPSESASSATTEPAMSASAAPSASQAPAASAAAMRASIAATAGTARPVVVPTAAARWTAPAPAPILRPAATPASTSTAAPAPRAKSNSADDNPY
jgi:uncharacterized protein (TIGR02266 family)